MNHNDELERRERLARQRAEIEERVRRERMQAQAAPPIPKQRPAARREPVPVVVVADERYRRDDGKLLGAPKWALWLMLISYWAAGAVLVVTAIRYSYPIDRVLFIGLIALVIPPILVLLQVISYNLYWLLVAIAALMSLACSLTLLAGLVTLPIIPMR